VKLVFVRHGETTWNAEDRMQGQLDAELSELGLQQARQAANALAGLKIDAIYSSDLQRAYVTAETIAQRHDLPVRKEPLLREVYLGAWQGLSLSEVQEQYPTEYAAYRADSIGNRPPSAERIESVIERAGRFLDKVTSEHNAGTIVVVAHGGIIRGALCYALDSGPQLFRRVKLGNAGFTSIEFPLNGRPLVIAVNDTCHLRATDGPNNVQEV
jgi:broad specificity phosphatase PhoE